MTRTAILVGPVKELAATVPVKGAAALMLMLGLAACQTPAPTTSGGGPETGLTAPAEPFQFEPASFVAQAQHVEGEYPDLFAPESHAIWVSGPVADAKKSVLQRTGGAVDPRIAQDAQVLLENFVIVELHLESAFSDMSVAYDAVALRNMSVYLESPGGNEVRPLQTDIGPVTEEQEAALKRFARTNLLIFPKHNLWRGTAVVAAESPSVRLVVDGYNATFQFEWPGVSGSPGLARPAEREIPIISDVNFNELFSRIRRLAHHFD